MTNKLIQREKKFKMQFTTYNAKRDSKGGQSDKSNLVRTTTVINFNYNVALMNTKSRRWSVPILYLQ